MNSAEFARLAGVSVRTLRHYHQVGVLPEPERRANGYRVYTVHDLVLLLRIRRLTELGIALDEVAPLLERSGGADAVLDALDRELAAQIDVLSARRDAIASLRSTGVSPDTPPELAAIIGAVGQDLPAELSRHDREMLLLLHHGLDEAGREVLFTLLSRMVDPALLPRATELALRFGTLAAEAGDDEIDQLVADYREQLNRLGDEEFAGVGVRTDAQLTSYLEATFNPAQLAFLERLSR